jgi:Chlorophyll A-B binding protein
MREAELKHARIAMLAVVGSIAQEAGFVVPGLVSLSLNVLTVVTPHF